jgi:hypothetical protein
MRLIKLILAFSPWILFKIIASPHSLTDLKAGIIAAFILSIILAVKGIHRGVILVGGLAFFGFCIIAVMLMNNMWVVKHMAVLANGTLASLSWFSIFAGRPFTMAYAKKEVDKKYWDSPGFIRKNYITTGVWALVFPINAAINAIKIYHGGMNDVVFEISQLAFILAAILATLLYKGKAA